MRAALVAVVLACASPAVAWQEEGHARVARAAVLSLSGKVPDFVIADVERAVHHSIDPDIRALSSATERIEHYFDLDLLEGKQPPLRRADFEKAHDHRKTGTAFYRILEEQDRLRSMFAEHRAAPKNRFIREKIVAQIGTLSHYTADFVQPLHTTKHYDGRVGKDGRSPRTGIHSEVDQWLGRLPKAAVRARPVGPGALRGRSQGTGDPWVKCLLALQEAHGLVDEVYRLQAKGDAKAIEAFTRGRADAAVTLTAEMALTAWLGSGQAALPDWVTEAR